MSLLPQNQVEQLDAYLTAEINPVEEPSKTYRIDFENSTIGNFTEELEALKQAIVKAILTPRGRYSIYDESYGCELWDLIGQNVTLAYLESEIPRMVTEAIIYDDRVNSVTNITFRKEGDASFIEMTVDSIYGEVSAEVII